MMKGLMIFYCVFLSFNQMKASDSIRVKSKASIYVGAGYNAYFNSMDLFKDGIRNNNYGVMARVMWEPRYRISLGFETGLLKMYEWENPITKNESISLYAVPFNSVVSMKIYKNWYINLAFGTSLLINSVNTKNEQEVASQFTVVNIYAETGYILKMSKHWSIVPALTYVFISKTEDRSLFLQTKIGYTF